jgi:hypothetical protein
MKSPLSEDLRPLEHQEGDKLPLQMNIRKVERNGLEIHMKLQIKKGTRRM